MTARKLRIRTLIAGMTATAALVVAAPASAGPLVASATDCESQSMSQPFLPWADVANYTLNRGGSFEPGDHNWSVSGASLVAGNEPWDVTDDRDGHALYIPSGATATSTTSCVGIEHPDIRFFAKGSNLSAQLNVEVLFEDAAGNVQSLPIGLVTGSIAWSPTLQMPIIANLLPLLPDSKTAVKFRLTASGGAFRIDDFYVDPIQRH